MDSASFSWDSPGATTLEPFTQHFQQGELTAIVGSVGSGKSSVLNAISGEMYLVSGRVKVAVTVGKSVFRGPHQQQLFLGNFGLCPTAKLDPKRYCTREHTFQSTIR